jgi:hypothetical protein
MLGAIGALTVAFIQTGVVGVGLSGFYVQFFYVLNIIHWLLGHRWHIHLEVSEPALVPSHA